MSNVLETYEQVQAAFPLKRPALFRCSVCGVACDMPYQDAIAAGYAVTRENQLVCYPCCADLDKRQMIEDGRIVLYLTHNEFGMAENRTGRHKHLGSYVAGKVTNWPGTLSFPCGVKIGRHNIARYRYDAWFTGPDGKPWHGVQYGDDTQIIHCRRNKS